MFYNPFTKLSDPRRKLTDILSYACQIEVMVCLTLTEMCNFVTYASFIFSLTYTVLLSSNMTPLVSVSHSQVIFAQLISIHSQVINLISLAYKPTTHKCNDYN